MATISCPQCKRLTDDGQRLCPGCKFNIRKYVKDIKKNGGVVSSGLSLGSVYKKEEAKVGGPDLEFLHSPAKQEESVVAPAPSPAPAPAAAAPAPAYSPAPAAPAYSPAPAAPAPTPAYSPAPAAPAPSASSEVSLGDVFHTTTNPVPKSVPASPYPGVPAPAYSSAPAAPAYSPAPAAPAPTPSYSPAPAAPAGSSIYGAPQTPSSPAALERSIYGTKPAAPVAPAPTPSYSPTPAAPAGNSIYGAPQTPPSPAALERSIYGTKPAAPAAPASNEPVFESKSLNRSDDLRKKAPTYQPTVGQLPGANNAGRSNPSATPWSASSANPISRLSADQLASIPRTSEGEPLFESASLNYSSSGGGALSGVASGPTIMEKLRMEREAKEAEASIFETMSLKKEEKALEAGLMQPLGGISGQPDTPMFGEHAKPEDRTIIPRSTYSAMPEGRSALGDDKQKEHASQFQAAAALTPWQSPKTSSQGAPAGYRSQNPSYQQPQQSVPGQVFRAASPAPAAPATPYSPTAPASPYKAPATPYSPTAPATPYSPQGGNGILGGGAPYPAGGGNPLFGSAPANANPYLGGGAPASVAPGTANPFLGGAPANANPYLGGKPAGTNPYQGGGTGQ